MNTQSGSDKRAMYSIEMVPVARLKAPLTATLLIGFLNRPVPPVQGPKRPIGCCSLTNQENSLSFEAPGMTPVRRCWSKSKVYQAQPLLIRPSNWGAEPTLSATTAQKLGNPA